MNQQPPPDPPLVALFRQNMWANLRLLDACAALDEAQLAATASGTYGSIYATLRHLVRAEQAYLNHLSGVKQGTPLGWDGNPDLATLPGYARQAGEGLIAVAGRITPVDIVHLEWDEKRWPVPASLILAQALNHAGEHRAQVMTIMTQLGIEPPELSGWAYIEEQVTPL